MRRRRRRRRGGAPVAGRWGDGLMGMLGFDRVSVMIGKFNP